MNKLKNEIEKIIVENNIETLRLELTTLLNKLPEKYVNCNDTEFLTLHGYREITVYASKIHKTTLIITITDSEDQPTKGHYLITIQNKNMYNTIIKNMKNPLKIHDIIENIIQNSIHMKFSTNEEENEPEIYTTDKLIKLTDVVIQMLKDELKPEKIMEFICGFRGKIIKHEPQPTLEELEKKLPPEILKNIKKETQNLENKIKKELNKP